MSATLPAAATAPPLTEDQQQHLLTAVAGMLRGAVTGQPAVFPPELTELRDQPVGGAFVSVKRGKHLRSCCGVLGKPVPLLPVLQHAAARTARDDVRFPPLSPVELDHLDVEVWLLAHPEPVRARGTERLEAVTIGKHGVQVVRGQAQALLLPGVAVENGWDAREFLDQVCVKAELPPTAWREDDTALFTFEGQSFRGRLGEPTTAPMRLSSPTRPEDLEAYVEFCRRELTALLSGATPSYYCWTAADGNLNGVVLLVRPKATELEYFSHISLRAAVPLQATLASLHQAAAASLAAGGTTGAQLATLPIGLMLLHDPAMHGTVADPLFAGLDTKHRALLVLERNKSALVYDPDRSADELLAEAASQAKVSQPGSASIFSLDVLTNVSTACVATVPKPVRGPAVRPAAAAGTFYAADPGELARTVDHLLAGERRAEEWPAALVPHAGLRYSGQIAADVLKRLRIPRTVLILGPKHTPLGVDWAVAPHQTWALPGGEVASDYMLARRLCEAIPGLEMDAAAHQREHGIEVELPLLARLAPESRVVGMAIGHGDLASCRRFAEGLAGLLRQSDQPPLLLISSDMNHFASDAESRRLDALALSALEGGDPELLYQTVTKQHISMCGVLPAVIVLETLRLLGRTGRVERVGYATSADVTGDTSRVVGYAGMLLA
jgi:AmmeMemoRadiSam system protein B/AmmeMemoRadiSam system protein A